MFLKTHYSHFNFNFVKLRFISYLLLIFLFIFNIYHSSICLIEVLKHNISHFNLLKKLCILYKKSNWFWDEVRPGRVSAGLHIPSFLYGSI